jgi:hypothetical protein
MKLAGPRDLPARVPSTAVAAAYVFHLEEVELWRGIGFIEPRLRLARVVAVIDAFAERSVTPQRLIFSNLVDDRSVRASDERAPVLLDVVRSQIRSIPPARAVALSSVREGIRAGSSHGRLHEDHARDRRESEQDERGASVTFDHFSFMSPPNKSPLLDCHTTSTLLGDHRSYARHWGSESAIVLAAVDGGHRRFSNRYRWSRCAFYWGRERS